MRKLLPVLLLLSILASCNQQTSNENTSVIIETKYGDITVLLYDDTPEHRDNFIKLVKEGFYDDLLFHRVMKSFMIQGGDPKSKGAPQGEQLGNGGPGYKVDAEIVYPEHFHKRGALAAARQPDQVNPDKQSSGSQFYIVQGTTYTMDQLSEIAVSRNDKRRQAIFYRLMPDYQDTLQMVQRKGDPELIKGIQDFIMEKVNEEFLKEPPFTFNNEQLETYMNVGGAPFLDGNYSVFGEVTQGMEVVDSIANVMTDGNDRPVEDVVMNIKIAR